MQYDLIVLGGGPAATLAQSVRAQQGFLFCASKKAAWAACA